MYKNKYIKYKLKYLQLKRLITESSTDDDSSKDSPKDSPKDKDSDLETNIRYFPNLEDKEKMKQLKIDPDSKMYISLQKHADKITNILISNMNTVGLNPSDATVTDGTGGVGGNTLSLAKRFKKVYSIEMNKLRSEYLENNVKVYGYNNVVVINGDTTKVVFTLPDQDVIIIDPPWGGADYKKYDRLKLTMSDIPIETLCLNLFNPSMAKGVPKIVAFKLPKNYDVKYFYYRLKGYRVKTYDLYKMILLVVFNK